MIEAATMQQTLRWAHQTASHVKSYKSQWWQPVAHPLQPCDFIQALKKTTECTMLNLKHLISQSRFLSF